MIHQDIASLAKPITSFLPDPDNARKHDPKNLAAIKASLVKFGQRKPIVCQQTDSGLIVRAGNGTLEAAQSLGWQELAAVVITEDNVTATGYAIADNRTAELADWDLGVLDETLFSLQRDGVDLLDLGFSEEDLAKLLPKEIEAVEGEDDVPEVVETICKPGDLWLLGEHRVLCGDSTDVLQVERLMNGQKADMVFVDPPYGVSYTKKNEYLNSITRGHRLTNAIKNDDMKPEEMNEFWFSVLSNIYIASSDKCSYYICSPQRGDLMMMMMMSIIRAGWQLKHILIWVKNNHVLGRGDYNYKHEPILYGWKAKGTHKFVGGGRCKTTVWDFNKPLKNDLHPTMKPVELCQEAILNSSEDGEIVLDTFLGSGSTLIASDKISRRCYGLELDPNYCDVIIARWEKFTGKKATLEVPHA